MSANCQFYGSVIGCKYGNQCSYSHSNPLSVPVCTNYQAGYCNYDLRCKFRHIDTSNDVVKDTIYQPKTNQNKYKFPFSIMNKKGNQVTDNSNFTSEHASKSKLSTFIWRITNRQYILICYGFIRELNNTRFTFYNISNLCTDYLMPFDLLQMFKTMPKFQVFQSAAFSIGSFNFKIRISGQYKFNLLLDSLPSPSIKRLQFKVSILFCELNKSIATRQVTLYSPSVCGQYINYMVIYFTQEQIKTLQTCTFKVGINELNAYTANEENITHKYMDKTKISTNINIWTDWGFPLLTMLDRNFLC